MIYEKPKNEIFASDAKDGEIVEFPNIKRGWGVTENLGFIPPMEYFNAAFNRVDKSIAYQLQRGVGEWDKDLEYPIGAVVSLNGVVYVAKSQNTNKNPSENKGIWKEVVTADGYNLDMLKEATSNSYGNTLVNRDANGDFAGRFISADHFKLKTPTQNNLFGESSEILFRGGASEDANYVRAVSGTYMLKALLGARGDGIFFQGVNENKGERGEATFGYIRLPGGVILQFGISHRMNPRETRVQYFPVAFPTHCLCVLVSAHMPIPNDAVDAAQTNSYDNAKFVMQNYDVNSSMHIAWMAIGV